MRMFEHVLTKNRCFLEGRYIIPQGIMVHSTGANNPNISRYVPVGDNFSSLHWDGPRRDACVHAFIGLWTDHEVAVCRTLPWNMRGWHAGVSGKPGCVSANNTHISFECCEDDLKSETYFLAVMEQATELCAYLCYQYQFDPMSPGVIISHHEGYLRNQACNHADIDHWLKRFGWTMDTFREKVAEKCRKEGDDMTYDKFKEWFDKYLQERYTMRASDWARDDIAFMKGVQGKDANGRSVPITDGSGPAALVTREQLMSMMARTIRK